MTMDAELKAKWVKALRSGEYQQCRMTLRKSVDGNTSHCCLGVLNEVRGVKNDPSGYIDFPNLVGDWQILARMNDEQGKSFNQIADYIEANL